MRLLVPLVPDSTDSQPPGLCRRSAARPSPI